MARYFCCRSSTGVSCAHVASDEDGIQMSHRRSIFFCSYNCVGSLRSICRVPRLDYIHVRDWLVPWLLRWLREGATCLLLDHLSYWSIFSSVCPTPTLSPSLSDEAHVTSSIMHTEPTTRRQHFSQLPTRRRGVYIQVQKLSGLSRCHSQVLLVSTNSDPRSSCD